MSYRLTKSKFILGLKCEKALYLDVYKPQMAYYSPETLTLFRQGRVFEAKIKASFPNGIDISKLMGRNIRKYPDVTAETLSKPGEVTLFEAGFVFNEVLVLADVVHRDADGNISVYEIKNSLSVKEVFRRDVCIQNYVISKCVDNLVSFSIIYNDGNDNALYEEMLPESKEAEPMIAEKVDRFKELLQGLEPQIAIDEHCDKPYQCPYRRYCERTRPAQLELADL